MSTLGSTNVQRGSVQELWVLHRFKNQEFWKFLSVWKKHIYIFPPASCLGLSREKWGAGIRCQGVHYVCGVCYRHCWHILLPNSLLDKGMIYYISLLLFYSFPSVFLESENRSLKKKKIVGFRKYTVHNILFLQLWTIFTAGVVLFLPDHLAIDCGFLELQS